MKRTIIDSRYQIVRQLGQGGMGAVYEATHLGTGRRVALKVIIAEALASSDGGDVIARFQREARASGKIESQHVVQVLDTGVDRETGCPYLVMEHLTGEDLQQIIRRLGPLAPDAVLRIASHACAGLARAHQEGIIHRDIKAANLFVAQREMGELVVKVLDFGIAKVRADPMSANAQSSITRTGSLLGSPLYMSPEQVVGNKSIDARSDVFSLGVTIYEALCGVPPHHEVETIGALVLAICSGKRESLQSRAFWVPDDVAAIVEKSLALDPADRFQTMTEMQAAIATLLPQGPILRESMLIGEPMLAANAHAPRSSPSQHVAVEKAATVPATSPGAPQSGRGLTAPISVPIPPSFAGATATGFGSTSSGGSAARRSSRMIAVPFIALFVMCAGGFGIYKLSTRRAIAVVAATSATSSMSAMTATTSVTPPAAMATTVEVVDSGTSVVTAAAPTTTTTTTTTTKHPTPPLTAHREPITPTTPPTPVKTAVTASARPAPNCNPNFYYDDKGVKRFKEECPL